MSRRSKWTSGYSLIELLFVIAIISIMTTSLVALVTQSSRGYRYLQTQSEASVDLSNTLNRVAKVVRGTSDVISAQPNSLSIYAFFSPNDAVVNKITYFVQGSTLKATVVPPTGTAPNYTYDDANGTTYTLADDLTGAGTVFNYFDASGIQLGSGFSVSQIKQISIEVTINPNTKVLRKPLTSQTTVTLRNKKTNL